VMKKIEITIFHMLFCLAVTLLCVSNIVKANPLVYSEEKWCLKCHDASSLMNVSDHVTADCKACHVGVAEKWNVHASKCIICHPIDNPGACALVLFHVNSTAPEAEDMNCDWCHHKCEPVVSPTTSTTGNLTTTTTITNSCPIEEIYGENSVEVAVLKNLRDTMLSTTPEGQMVIRLYYELSPVILMAIQHDEELRTEMKEMIDGVLEVDAAVD